MSQIVRQIISEYSEQHHDAPFGLDEFGQIKQMVDDYRWREWVTESENYGTEEVAEEITTHSADPRSIKSAKQFNPTKSRSSFEK